MSLRRTWNESTGQEQTIKAGNCILTPGLQNLVKQPFPTQEATEAKESSTGPTGGDEIASGDLVRSGNLQSHRFSKGYFYCM